MSSLDNNDNLNSKSLLGKKVDLLTFQNSLNEKFYEVFKSDNLELSKENEELGLIEEVSGLVLLFSLKDLKKISSDSKVETVNLVKSWILGFNQLQGDVFTVVDFEDVISNVIGFSENNNTKFLKKTFKNKEYNTVYLKTILDNKFAIILNNLLLESTKDFELIIEKQSSILENVELMKKNSENLTTFLNNLDIVLNKSEKTVLDKCLSYLDKTKELSLNDNNISIEDSNESEKIDNKEKEGASKEEFEKILIINSLIENVYFDKKFNRPIFSINVEKLINLLITISPF